MSLNWDELTVNVNNTSGMAANRDSYASPNPGEYGTEPVQTLPSAATTTAFVGRSSSGAEIGFAVSSVVYQFANNMMLTISSHMPFAAGQHTTVDVSLIGASASNYSLSGSLPGHDWKLQGRRDTADIAVTPAATPGTGTTTLHLSNKN